jgi:hypothetical protein
MNKKLTHVIARLCALPEDRQEAAAALLVEFLDREDVVELTPEQIDELERYLEELIAERMVTDFFHRARSRRDRSQS